MSEKETQVIVGGPRVYISGTDSNQEGLDYFLGSFKVGPWQFEILELADGGVPEVDDAKPHFHEIMTEVTYVIDGKLTIRIKDEDGVREEVLTKGQKMLVDPGAIIQNLRNEKGTKVLVVKFPSVPGDKKYYLENI